MIPSLSAAELLVIKHCEKLERSTYPSIIVVYDRENSVLRFHNINSPDEASITITNAPSTGSQCVLYAKALHGRPCDGHTLASVITETQLLN